MRARFQPDEKVAPKTTLVDPEAYDASEQQFAASLETSGPRFVVEEESASEPTAPASAARPTRSAAQEPSPAVPSPELRQSEELTTLPPRGDSLLSPERQSQDPYAWRQEVAARLNQYRARRRPREPRYPSLRLKFESNEPARSLPDPATAAMNRSAVAAQMVAAPAHVDRVERLTLGPAASAVEPSARVIPFPRSSAIPPRPLEELAEPVPSRPRILEAPEIAPPPPALGGILIEPETELVDERRPGFEVPLQSAAFGPRLLAAAADGLLVLTASAFSGWIFLKLTATTLPLRQSAILAAGAAGVCWAGYQYLLLVHAGSTPGLKLARLRLAQFDGSSVPRRTRRWRVLASILSAISLGLGYAWCVLDEDQLCWHDRITHTYLAPRPRVERPKKAV
jgi:uncharacterized RDD family membrane protein YckC